MAGRVTAQKNLRASVVTGGYPSQVLEPAEHDPVATIAAPAIMARRIPVPAPSRDGDLRAYPNQWASRPCWASDQSAHARQQRAGTHGSSARTCARRSIRAPVSRNRCSSSRSARGNLRHRADTEQVGPGRRAWCRPWIGTGMRRFLFRYREQDALRSMIMPVNIPSPFHRWR